MHLPPPMLFQQTAAQEPYVLLEETGGGYIAQPSGHEVFYDEAAGLLHIVEGRMVSAVALPGRSSAAENKNSTTAAATSLSSSSSLLLAPLSNTPESQQRHQEGEENKGLFNPSPTPISALHRRTVSDAVSIASTTTSTTPSRAFLVSSGPPITAVRASLDGNFTALQRSKLQIEFLDHSNGNMFVETPQQNKSASAVLHGFFWTDAPEAEFVLVTSMGLELYAPKIGSQGLKYTAFQRLSAVQWFIWSHSTRILVAGCGSSGAKLQAFQFSRHHSGGVARLSMLDLTPPWGSPTKIPSKSILNQGHNAAVHAAPWLLVSPTQIWVLLLYRRVFIAYHDLSSNTLKLYRIYRDSTALFAECPLKLTSTAGQSGGYHPGPGKIELSVVEDVLVVHFVQQHAEDSTSSGGSGCDRGRGLGGTAVLFDIAGEGVRGPTGVRIIDPIVSTPTQLGVILLDGGVKVQENEEIEEQQRDGEVEYEHGVQQQKLSLFHPALALDQASGRIFRLRIDLLALSEACFSSSAAAADRDGDILSILAFLHRRQERRYSGQRGYSIIRDHRRDPRHVILRVLRRIVNDRASPALLRSAFDAVLAPLRRQEQQKNNYKKRNSDNNEKQEEDDGDDDYRSVHAKEIALGILAPALQLTSPRPAAITPPPPPPAAISNTTQSTAAANYVLAALSELFTSCYATGNYPVNADVASLYLTAYSNAGREYLLPGLLNSHAQLLDSTELAERLASGDVLLARHDKGSSISNTSEHQLLTSLALDMYTRLGNHKQVCKLLLQQGNVLAAVKHAQLFLMVDPGVLEDPEHIFNAAYSALNNSTSMSRGGEEDNKVLKIALGRILEDKKTSSSYHPSSSSAAAVDALAATSSQFLDQQTASLVEALENF